MSFKCRKEELHGTKCIRQCRGCLLQETCQNIVDSGQVIILPANSSIITIEAGAVVDQIIGKQVIINVGSNSQSDQTIPSTTGNSGQCQEKQSACN